MSNRNKRTGLSPPNALNLVFSESRRDWKQKVMCWCSWNSGYVRSEGSRLRGTLNTSSNYSRCPQNSRHSDTLYSFGPVVTVLAYSMTELENHFHSEGSCVGWDGSDFLMLLYSLRCYEAGKKTERYSKKGDFTDAGTVSAQCLTSGCSLSLEKKKKLLFSHMETRSSGRR